MGCKSGFSPESNTSINTYTESSYEVVKSYERFQFVKSIFEKKVSLNQEYSVLDIGCAKGEFFYFLLEHFSNLNMCGIEYSETLIQIAKAEKQLSKVEFVIDDAREFDLNQSYDFVFLMGVLSIFDEPETVINQMIKHLSTGGYGYIFGGFNEADIDVLVRYKNNEMGSQDWESGLNSFSKRTIEKLIEGSVSEFKWVKFDLKQTIIQQKDPVKTFTQDLIDGKRLICNGANMIRDFWLLEFKKK